MCSSLSPCGREASSEFVPSEGNRKTEVKSEQNSTNEGWRPSIGQRLVTLGQKMATAF